MTGPGGIERFLRPQFREFSGYSASTSPETLEGRIQVAPDDIVKLNANENPYGCSPRVLKALADNPGWHVYPDNGQELLRRRLAGYAGAPAERIIAGHGSNTLIDYLVRLFVGPGDEVINCQPTFDLYRFSTQIYGGTLIDVPRNEDFALDIDAMCAAVTERTKLIFLASPNNPTGNTTPQADIRKLLETGVPVIVDEAYYEFSGETAMPMIDDYQNLLILRSFSKWAGLAGLRIGYGVFPPAVAGYLMATKIPHNVSAAAEVAVRESLADVEYLQQRIQQIVRERERLYNELKTIPYLRPYPSQANFIFCTLRDRDATELHDALEAKGVLIRNFVTSVRISVGTPDQNDILLKTLRAV